MVIDMVRAEDWSTHVANRPITVGGVTTKSAPRPHPGGPHATHRAKACHCSPHPHHPCAHTHLSAAKKAAASKKAKATAAGNLAKAKKLLAAHPPTTAQINAANALDAAMRAAAPALAKQRKAHQTAAQRTKAHNRAAKAAATRARHKKAHTHPAGGAKKKPGGMSPTFLAAALKSVREQNKKLAAAKHKHRANTNPHHPAGKKAAKTKC